MNMLTKYEDTDVILDFIGLLVHAEEDVRHIIPTVSSIQTFKP